MFSCIKIEKMPDKISRLARLSSFGIQFISRGKRDFFPDLFLIASIR
ncbi:hypothetical protein LRU_00673 [Ligilactobacillus ruminis SPM0211]|uniref:Uncharacterized protein n=1 Tax=Ligilactobacillus ruminis SPM0211 TaxID=1040964 RepID=F7QZ31_9LACO|nr:hypothetical protein LRU_00673 [Ligilactobacillus ruminis SPM0211]